MVTAGAGSQAGAAGGGLGADGGVDAGDAGSIDGGRDMDAGLDGGEAGRASEVEAGPDNDAEVPEPIDCLNYTAHGGVVYAGLDGVVLWLVGSGGVAADENDRLHYWWDSSPFAHLANAAGDPEDRPVWLPADEHGHRSVRFGYRPETGKARRLEIEDAPSLQFGVKQFAMIVVLRYRNVAAVVDTLFNDTGLIYGKQSTADPYLGVTLLANDSYEYSEEVPNAQIRSSFAFQLQWKQVARGVRSSRNDDRVRLVVAQRIGQQMTLDVDGERDGLNAPSTALDVSAVGFPVRIGANASNTQALDGDIYELVVVAADATRFPVTDYSPSEVTDMITACLMEKYGLPR